MNAHRFSPATDSLTPNRSVVAVTAESEISKAARFNIRESLIAVGALALSVVIDGDPVAAATIVLHSAENAWQKLAALAVGS